jgi:hypothetical protein
VRFLAVVALVALSAQVALAHPDTLGAPDPYWQQVAATSGVPGDGSGTATRGDALPRLRRVLVYGSAVAFVACAGSLLRALRATRRPRS